MAQTSTTPRFSQFDRIEHVRRGGDYVVLGEATLQMEPGRSFSDYDSLTVYLSEHGRLCARAPDELADGRFVGTGLPYTNEIAGTVDELSRAIADGSDPQPILERLRSLAARSVLLDERATIAGRTAFENVG